MVASTSLLLSACALLLVSSVSASPALVERAGNVSGYTGLVVFGDSFSDNGGVHGARAATNGSWPPSQYYGGRFSNGIVWAEYVASNLSLPLYDYAVGGATTSNKLVQGYTGKKSDVAVPSLGEQIQNYISNGPKNQSKPLFVLWGGANDIIFNISITGAQSFRYLAAEAQTLLNKYPTGHVVVVSQPPLNNIPYAFYVNAGNKTALARYSTQLRTLLAQKFASGNSTARGAATQAPRTSFVDVYELFENFSYYASPQQYGFDPLGYYGSCLAGTYGETPNITLCSNPNQRVYWDEFHPTTRTHQWIAQAVLKAIG